MRRSQAGQHLSDECLDACRFKLTAVLVRLTTGHRYEEVNAAERFAESPVWESMTELALFCMRNPALNRMEWTSFLTRQVSEALERIDNGTYGLCLQCRHPISAERLAALPWVAFCIACQERKAERRAM
jgi:RNA polymerase-binding transcription factor DksA